MTDFDFPTRFDDTVADDGIWIEVIDEKEQLWGSFKCKLIDRTLPRYKLVIEQLQRKYNGKGKTKAERERLAANLAAELFVKMALVDWKDVKAKGKDVPFDVETAIKYFSAPQAQFVLSKLYPEVEDVTNFQSEEQSEAGDAAGN